jgi:hypothetical protein
MEIKSNMKKVIENGLCEDLGVKDVVDADWDSLVIVSL